MRRLAELRKGLFGYRVVLNEPLPRPFRKLSRLHIGRRIKEDDGAAIGQSLDQRPHENELSFGEIVEPMENDPVEPVKPDDRIVPDLCGGEQAAVLWIEEPGLPQPAVVM